MDEKLSVPKPAPFLTLTKILLGLVFIALIFLAWIFYHKYQQQKLANRPMGLEPLAFQPLPLGSIKPKGWLLEQLKLQAGGLSGHLDEFWPDVEDSGWIGGIAEGWERAPYWLDGVIPLAFLADDDRLKQKSKRWIDYILSHPQSDGWLGPEKGLGPIGTQAPPNAERDPWPQFVILKALAQYQEATGDPRIIPAMLKDLASLNVQLDTRPLFAWNFFRWGDLLVSLYWLYDHTREAWLLDLAYKAATQGYNWPKHFSDLPVKEKSPQWNWVGHVVNNAMGIKTPAMLYRLTGDERFKKIAQNALSELDRYHGEPNGLFSGDECLAGRNPSQGTELCAIVETMFSLENSLSVLGDVVFADRLEKIAFNALPAAISPDYWTHQYVEQSNQVACVYDPNPIYTTNNGVANIFGLEPQFGCCTANFHQGWPKFVSHLWMTTPDGGLAAMLYAPSTVQTTISGIPISVELITDYPFNENLTFEVSAPEAVEFPFYFRVPEWTQGAILTLPDGTTEKLKPGTFQKVFRKWNGHETLRLNLPMSFQVRRGFQDSVSVERGPLVYSLGLKELWKPVRPFRFQPKGGGKNDFVLLPQSAWNYALLIDTRSPDKSLNFESGPLQGDPFTLQGAPVKVSVSGCRLQNWSFVQGAAEPPPQSPVQSSAPMEQLTLVPYGSTRLRMTEFPLLK